MVDGDGDVDDGWWMVDGGFVGAVALHSLADTS
jgi:uncharacterized membrane protein